MMTTIKDFEVHLLADRKKYKRKPANDFKKWPAPFRLGTEAAISKKMSKMPKGSRIIFRESRCDVRADLSGIPWQLSYMICVEIPA